MLTVSDLVESVANANGSRRTRVLDRSDVELFVELVNRANDNIHTIRVYSSAGFVANSYKYRADISYLQADRQEDGTFHCYASTCDAKRSHGNGALVTVNGRAV